MLRHGRRPIGPRPQDWRYAGPVGGYTHWHASAPCAVSGMVAPNGERTHNSGTTTEASFAPEATSVRAARQYVASLLPGLSREDSATITLLASELATNAIVHGGTPFTVRVARTAGVIRVEVEDHGGGTPRRRAHDPTRVGGLGLAMVEAGATLWGVACAGQRTQVWFELRIDAERDAHEPSRRHTLDA